LTRTDKEVQISEIGETGKYYVTVPYDEPGAATTTGDVRTSFEIGGGTKHITQSISTTNSYAPAAKTAPDFKGAINVNGKQEVRGVDVPAATGFQFSETHVFAAATVTEAYINQIADMASDTPVNSDTFRGRAIGEVYFLGASGSSRDDGKYEVTFRFAVSKNATGLTVGAITAIAKAGWEYLWVFYEPIEDGVANKVVMQPAAVYVEKIFNSGNYATELGI
jgi:hypothetical protein